MTRDGILPRRRFIHLGSLGLATSIAGCNTTTDNQNTPDEIDGPNNTPPSGDDTEPDGAPEPRPENSPASFQGNVDYEFQDLPQPPETFSPNLDESKNSPAYEHPDNKLFTVVIDEETAHITLEHTRLTRDILLTLRLRDEDGNMQTVDQRLESASGGYQTYELDFDISDISLPQSVGGFCELVGRDTHEHARDDYLFTRHQYVAIPYKNGVHWINSDTLQVYRSTSFTGVYSRGTYGGVTQNGEVISKATKPGGVMGYIDDGGERILFLAVRNSVNGEVYGVSCTIDKSAYNDYKTGSITYQRTHGLQYECRKANQITHIKELGRKTADVLTRLDITDPRERLEALGDLTQMIPYTVHDGAHPPTLVLYEAEGDCHTKAGVFSAITETDSWNTKTAFITCNINGGPHVTTGIDVDELDDDFGFTVSPTDDQINDGYRDAEYAFFDMTYDSTIGHRGGSVSGPYGLHGEGDYAHEDQWVASESPDY